MASELRLPRIPPLRFEDVVPDDLISESAAAAILGVSLQRVNQIRAEGKLAAAETVGVGRTRILYRRSDVERLRAERGVGRYGRTQATVSPVCTSP